MRPVADIWLHSVIEVGMFMLMIPPPVSSGQCVSWLVVEALRGSLISIDAPYHQRLANLAVVGR